MDFKHLTEYVDFAEYYDLDHAIAEDIPFYLGYARHLGSPVLELACGTGRVLVPLAEAGFEVYGVDISRNMLDVCQHAVDRFNLNHRVCLNQASMIEFALGRRDFKWAFAALRSFMHLLTPADQMSCLRYVRAHLAPGGYLIISLIAPDPNRLAEPPGGAFEVRREFDLPNGHHVIRKQRLVDHDRLSQIRRFEFRFEEYDRAARIVRERVVPMSMRYSFRDELEDRLIGCGFDVVKVLRGYDGSQYDGTGEMLIIARSTGG